MTNGTRSARAGRASSSARARRFLRRSNRSASSSWTRSTRHLQAGGSAALSRARRGHHARPDGKRRRRARLGHAVAWKVFTIANAASSRCWNCRSAWTTRKCRTSASWTCGRRARRKRPAAVFAAAQGGHHAAAGTRRADDFVFEPARLLDFAAMSEMRLRGRVPELQRRR